MWPDIAYASPARGYDALDSRAHLAYECSRVQLRKYSRVYGSSENLFYRFWRFNDPGRHRRLRKGRQRGIDHRRLNHRCAIARGCVSVARTSHGWVGHRAYHLAFARRTVHAQTFADRKDHARWDNVAHERDRDHRGHRRLGAPR